MSIEILNKPQAIRALNHKHIHNDKECDILELAIEDTEWDTWLEIKYTLDGETVVFTTKFLVEVKQNNSSKD